METPEYITILKLYATEISVLLNTTGPDDMIVVKRIFHILNVFLINCKIDTLEKERKITSILKSISYAPPWDCEDVIFDHLHKLCEYLSNYYSNNQDLEKAITEDITNISILEEIQKILTLEIKLDLELELDFNEQN